MTDDLTRCSWPGNDPLYIAYHDTEWGVPDYDSQRLFEKLILDGFQAGLSWITILRKREGFRAAFDQFDPEKIARYDNDKIAELMANSGIIRNRLKINNTVRSAQLYLDIEKNKPGGFSEFIWQFTDGKVIQNNWASLSETPTESAESRAMSKALMKRGFRFCGPTICYAFMQAVGMVNDHSIDCFRHQQLQ
ncbi:MAG: DNA-3-methyladenine glycosylase I [Kordiimonas sp.]|nr:DNA-3-methyladenine glycosylase I [Kordiimonas sp.]|tara:strand:- start:187 stop:762 length:576 start_codon:yes stop_codon:yes gene_type:complete